jgi:acetoin utilization protein AcuB
MLVKNWMSKNVITVEADDSMQHAVKLLKEHKINLLPVMKKGKLVGVITDRDLKKSSPSEATALDMHEILYLLSTIKVKDIMPKRLYTVPDNYTVEETAEMLLEKRISGVPVTDEKGKLVGVITKNDIFRLFITLTGLGKKGVQIAVQLKDAPGSIKEIREMIRKYDGRTASILTSSENTPEGKFNVYFRIYQVEKAKLPSLIKDIQGKGTVLYMVDHRDGKRTVYSS